MSQVRLNYDGWLALPANVRQALDLATGDRLDVELADGAVTLRPARQAGTAAAPRATATSEPTSAASSPSTVKRGPGRPRKDGSVALPSALKTRGRRATAPAASAGKASLPPPAPAEE
jgi:AbrB family looped-hinge helix DNA binding protein